MKYIAVKKILDTNQTGIFRGIAAMVGIYERHIQQLHTFMEGRDIHSEISNHEMVLLANIILDKKTLNKEFGSSPVFIELAEMFGGYPVLQLLQANDKLTATNLIFLNKTDQSKRDDLVNLIILCGMSAHHLYEFLKKSPNNSQLSNYRSALEILKSRLVLTDKVINTLFASTDISKVLMAVKTMTWTLDSKNIINILTLRDPDFIVEVYDVLSNRTTSMFDDSFPNTGPFSPECYDILFECGQTITKRLWVTEILELFKIAKWDVTDYFKRILEANDQLAVVFKMEMEQFVKIKEQYSFTAEQISGILNAIFTTSPSHFNVVAVETLINNDVFTDGKLDQILAHPQHALNMASAIVLLEKEKLYNDDSKEFISSSAEHAVGLAKFYIQYQKVKNGTDYLSVIKLWPEFASDTAEILELLKLNYLNSYLPNLVFVFNNLNHSRNLANALRCLADENELDQQNFESLFDTVNDLMVSKEIINPGSSPDGFFASKVLATPVTKDTSELTMTS